MSKGICVVAIGGNAIINEHNEGTVEEQIENIRIACSNVVSLIQKGYQVVLTHGNGPQVGQALLRHKLAASEVPEGTLDTNVAETQGLLGYLIQQTMRNELDNANLSQQVISVITQVLVDKRDPSFENPTKPIGPFYSAAEAQDIAAKYNKRMVEDSGRGFRMTVPSPMPVDIVEKEFISALVRSGAIVIAAGGGGIPVVKEAGRLVGVEAVIDKDVASSVLAKMIGADYLLLLTGVDKVCINYRQPDERQLDEVEVEELHKYLQEGQFPEGSMGPKIRAAISFVEEGGNKSIITSLPNMCAAMEGKTGTAVVRDSVARHNFKIS